MKRKQTTKKLKEIGQQLEFEYRDVKPYTLKEMLKRMGMKTAAEKFDVSLSTIRSWRWGYRRPSVDQAKKIIIASNYQLDFEAIYGAIEDV